MSSDFPSSKFDRGKIFAKTGLKLGTNYAKRYLQKTAGKEESDEDRSRFHSKNARQVFNNFIKLRGTALKIAQSLSMDQGALPDEFAEVMTEAQYNVPPINKALTRSIIKKELGEYPEKIFPSFRAEAIAAASIGQVHEAFLKDGTKLAIKIQYPNVRNTIHSDIELARSFLKGFMKKNANLDEYLGEVENMLLEETDYTREGQYIDYFHQRFSGEKIIIPVWFKEYSTQKVLTMSFMEGKHLREFLATNPSRKRRNHFGQLLWNFFHDQVEQRDFIHADTHPGNFLFTDDDKLGVIDFGCVKKFPVEFTYNYMLLLPTHLEKNEDQIRRLYQELDIVREHPEDPEKEERFFQFCKKYGNTFAQPYLSDEFNFGDPEFKKQLNQFAKEPMLINEPRGDKNFIYSTKVHLGLYSLLMKLEARIDTTQSKATAFQMLDEMKDIPG